MITTIRPLTGIVLLLSVFISVSCAVGREAVTVEFVVGDLLTAEGGQWEPKGSPLKSPFGIDFSPDGTMYIVELAGGRVHTCDSAGKLQLVAGDGSQGYLGDGSAFATATFNGMHNCAVTPNGDLYIADSWNHCIRKVDSRTSIISTVAGSGRAGFGGDGGPGARALFNYVMCITLNSTGNQLHIADLKNLRIRVLNLSTGLVDTVAGNGEKGVPVDGSLARQSPLFDPRAVAADSKGRIYILERGGHALRAVLHNGQIKTLAGTGEKGFRDGAALEAQLAAPKHICIDDCDNVYIADEANQAIRKYNPVSQKIETVLGRTHGDSRIRLSKPHGVCWHDGCLYVVDTGHNRILRLR